MRKAFKLQDLDCANCAAKMEEAVKKIDGVKFKRKVVPGDTLHFEVQLLEPIRRGVAVVEGKAFVGETLACEATMMAQIVKNKE